MEHEDPQLFYTAVTEDGKRVIVGVANPQLMDNDGLTFCCGALTPRGARSIALRLLENAQAIEDAVT